MKRWIIGLVVLGVGAPLQDFAAGSYLGGSWLSTSAEFDTSM